MGLITERSCFLASSFIQSVGIIGNRVENGNKYLFPHSPFLEGHPSSSMSVPKTTAFVRGGNALLTAPVLLPQSRWLLPFRCIWSLWIVTAPDSLGQPLMVPINPSHVFLIVLLLNSPYFQNLSMIYVSHQDHNWYKFLFLIFSSLLSQASTVPILTQINHDHVITVLVLPRARILAEILHLLTFYPSSFRNSCCIFPIQSKDVSDEGQKHRRL